MPISYLENLSQVVDALLQEEENVNVIAKLKEEIKNSPEPFTWSIINLKPYSTFIPPNIKSGWIFVLKQDTPSESHFHPNSVQHMTMIEGKGRAHIGGIWSEIELYDKESVTEDYWVVIDQGVPHEFFPEKMDMVVISFHTCEDKDLIEIDAKSQRSRAYQS